MFSQKAKEIHRRSGSPQAPLNYTKAQELAALAEMNTADGSPRKVRSIIAKAIRMGVEYSPQVTKTGEAVVRKDELVAQIALAFGVAVDALAGLERARRALCRHFGRCSLLDLS